MRSTRRKPSTSYRQTRLEDSRVVGLRSFAGKTSWTFRYWIAVGILLLGILLGLGFSDNSEFFSRVFQLAQSDLPTSGAIPTRLATRETISISESNPMVSASRVAAFENSVLLRLTQLETITSKMPKATELSSFEDKLLVLESQLSKLVDSDFFDGVRHFGGRIDLLEQQFEEVGRFKPTVAAPAENAVQLTSEVQEPVQLSPDYGVIRERQSTISTRLDSLSGRTRVLEELIQTGNYGVAVLLSSNRLRVDLEAGAVSVSNLQVLRDLSESFKDNELREIVARLETLVGHDILNYAQLITSFTNLSKEIISAQHVARDTNWVERSMRRLQSVISVRRIKDPVPGSLDEALFRAKVAITEKDLTVATAVLEKLVDTSHFKLSKWLMAARARLTIETAINELDALAIEKLDKHR